IARVVPEAGAAAGEQAATAPDESPEEARFRFFAAMGTFVRNAAAADRPLVLVLDDLHWADASSLLLLGFLAQEARSAPVLVVGSAARFRFNHALVRETIYDELGTVRRLRLHLKVGEALEAVHGRAHEPHVAELAHHWFEALPLAGADKAVEYSIAAARR